ncbi:MAG: zinc ribbon domain-containing protein [Elusimicrobia bacterium]|nr:zinc ribbon domain-containing protein [Elusimicrobiota bacterium]
MPETGYSRIVCTKCAAQLPVAGYACPKCQSSLAKVCGNCSFQNAVAKNYCDRCGTPMVLAPAASGASPFGSAAPAPLPNAALQRSGPPQAPSLHIVEPPSGLSIPAAQRREPGAPAPVPEGHYIPPPPPTEVSLSRLRRRDSRFSMIFWAPIAAVFAAAGFLYYDYQKPQSAIPRAAAQYLDALSRGDVAGAYALLSNASRIRCTLDEFRAGREETPWTWSDISLARLEPEAAVVKYRLQVKGQPAKDDYLIFLREDRSWVRPYNWNLLQRAEEAFIRSDPDMALIMAQAAVDIDPRDPMARGYLCEAVYYRKVPTQTEKECAAALKLAQVYPSKLSLKSLYHLHAILGDTYKNALQKYPEAVAEYDALLAFPDLTPADQCDLLLARADTRLAMGQNPEATADLQAAVGICTKPEDLGYIRKRRAALSEAPPQR